MITREQIEEIQTDSREKGVSIKMLLEERGIPAHQYFWWKRKYSKQEVAAGFLPVAGTMPPAMMSMASGAGNSQGKSKADPAGENWMSIELRTVTGTDMRIQGGQFLRDHSIPYHALATITRINEDGSMEIQ